MKTSKLKQEIEEAARPSYAPLKKARNAAGMLVFGVNDSLDLIDSAVSEIEAVPDLKLN